LLREEEGAWRRRRRKRRVAVAAPRAGHRRDRPAPSPMSRRERGSVRERERERRGERKFVKENQKPQYIFVGPYSHEEQRKVAQATESDEELQ
jgi:hypothetical protein